MNRLKLRRDYNRCAPLEEGYVFTAKAFGYGIVVRFFRKYTRIYWAADHYVFERPKALLTLHTWRNK